MPTPYSLIPVDPVAREREVKRVRDRYVYSRRYHESWFIRWVRYFKIWRGLKEQVDKLEESDEPNSFIPYAFSLVEDLHAKSVEPILRQGLPLDPKPKMPGHHKQAEAFAAVARAHFGNDEWQTDYMMGAKERVITGSMWERDAWADSQVRELRWRRVDRPVSMPVDMGTSEAPVPTSMTRAVPGWELIEDAYTERMGYHTIFPSAFHVLPEPGVVKLSRLKWLLEEEPAVPVQDLQAEMFTDPASGARVPVYDLSEVFKSKQQGGDKTIRPESPDVDGQDYYEIAREALAERVEEADPHNQDDGIDRLYLVHEFDDRGVMTTIANGKWIIRKSQLPIGKIPHRIRRYTLDPHFLLGIGAIEPVEDLVYELNDIHDLSMANWIRAINRMTAVNAAMLVDENDLEWRPGGFVRFNGNVHDAMRSLEVSDVTPSMLTQESNAKGLIERATASADFAPGPRGTKQSHDTATGVREISRNIAVRVSILRRIDMAVFKQQMWSMERHFSFYQFTPMPFETSGPDGSTTIMEVSNESIYTDGKGFSYVYRHDPSFGDEFVKRAQLLDFWAAAMAYEKWRIEVGGRSAPSAELPNLFKDMGKSFGYEDSSYVLKQPDGVLEPDDELRMMLSGVRVEVNPRENLSQHLIEHINQRMGPEFLKAAETGKVPPEVVAELDDHIVRTRAALAQIMSDPGAFAEADRTRAAMQGPMRGPMQ